MKKLFLVATIVLGSFTALSAQSLKELNIFSHLGAGVGVGTNGIEVELATPVTDFVQVRAGVAIVPNFKVTSVDVDIPSSQWTEAQNKYNQLVANKFRYSAVDQAIISEIESEGFMKSSMPNKASFDAKLHIGTSFKFLVDVYPIKVSSFHVTAGFFAGPSHIFTANNTNCEDQLEAMTYYNEKLAGQTFTTVDGTAQSTTFGKELSVTLGGDKDKGVNDFKPYGRSIDAAIKVSGFKPYLGIGIGRAVPTKTRLAFAMDLGVKFWSSPKVVVNQMDDNGSIYEKAVVTDGISDNNGGDVFKIISKFKVYPCLSFRLTGRIF